MTGWLCAMILIAVKFTWAGFCGTIAKLAVIGKLTTLWAIGDLRLK